MHQENPQDWKKLLKSVCTQTPSSNKHFLCVISHSLIVISPQGENEAISQHGGLPQVVWSAS